MSKRAASGPPPPTRNDDDLPPAGRDRMLNLWKPHNPSPLQIIASLVMPQTTTTDTTLIENTHPFDIDPARLEARTARVVGYWIRHPAPPPADAPIDPSESMAGLDYYPWLDTRPSFVDMYEAAMALGDHATLAEMDGVLAEPVQASLRNVVRAHYPRLAYAAAFAGDLVTVSKIVPQDDSWITLVLLGLLEGGHFELFLQLLHREKIMLTMNAICTWVVAHKKTHLLTQGNRLERIYGYDRGQIWLACTLNMMLTNPNEKWRELLIALAALARVRQPEAIKNSRTRPVILINVLVALVDPANPRDPAYYEEILTAFGFDLERDFPNAVMQWSLRRLTKWPSQLLEMLVRRCPHATNELRQRMLLEDATPRLETDSALGFGGSPFHVHVDVHRAVTILTTLPVLPVFHGLSPDDWPRLLDRIPPGKRQTFLTDQILELGATDPSAIALLDILAREYGPAGFAGLYLEERMQCWNVPIDYLKALSNHLGAVKVMLGYVRELLSIALTNGRVREYHGFAEFYPTPMGNFLPALRALHALCPPGTVHRDSALHRALVNLCKYVKTPEMDHFVDTMFPK